MCVSFKLLSDAKMQLKLHKSMRRKIPEWENQYLIRDGEAELTYHHKGNIETDFLQCVLNLDITPFEEENLDLSPSEDNQVPKDINEYIENLCKENQIRLRKHNHDKEMDNARMKEGREYWEGRSNKEIVRICSNGTRIALGILSMLKEDRDQFKHDRDVRGHIVDQIKQKLDADFEPVTMSFRRAWHETCNPLGVWGEWEARLFSSVLSDSDDCLKLIKARSLEDDKGK